MNGLFARLDNVSFFHWPSLKRVCAFMPLSIYCHLEKYFSIRSHISLFCESCVFLCVANEIWCFVDRPLENRVLIGFLRFQHVLICPSDT